MPEPDVYLKREQDAALSTFRQNRDELLNFYKSLGQLSRDKIPKKLKDEEQGKELMQAESLLRNQISRFSSLSLEMDQAGVDASVGRLAIAMFLIDRAKKLRELVLRNDNVSQFSLYVSLRTQLCAMLEEPFYSKGPEQIINDYLDLDPLLAACSEICGLSTPTLGEIVVEYKKALSEAVSMEVPPGAIEKEEPAREPGIPAAKPAREKKAKGKKTGKKKEK